MVHVISSLGGYLRWDREDFTKDKWNATTFVTSDEADTWIVNTYGRNGLKYFFAKTVMGRNEDEDDGAE